jgi:hypothetical protein
MSSEFAARLGWTESLGRSEAKVLGAALQAALGADEAIEELSEGEEELLDNLTEGILVEKAEGGDAWTSQMGEADRETVATCLLWLQYPEGESPLMEEAAWRRLEEVALAVGVRAASLAGNDLVMA